jgi:hypothetical protein
VSRSTHLLSGSEYEQKEESTDQDDDDTCEEQEIQNRGDVIRNRPPLERRPHPTPVAVVAAVETKAERSENKKVRSKEK